MSSCGKKTNLFQITGEVMSSRREGATGIKVNIFCLFHNMSHDLQICSNMTHDQQICFNMFYSISLELELENGKDSLHSSTSKASVFYQREHGKFKIENTNIIKYKYDYSRCEAPKK